MAHSTGSGGPVMLINNFAQHRHIEAIPPDFYTSFLTGLNVDLPAAAGAWACTRATSKYQQRIITAGDLLGINAGAITQAISGTPIHPGLISESPSINDFGNSDDLSNVNWTKVRCNVSAKNLVDPYGIANEAQTLTPTAAPPGYIRRQSGNNCAGLNYQGSVWLASVDGPPHTARIRLEKHSDTADGINVNVNLDTDWQCVCIEHLFNAAPNGFPRFYIYPDVINSTKRVKARLPFGMRDTETIINPAEVANTAIEHYWLAAPAAARGDQGSFSVWVYPLHAPDDGAAHPYFAMAPINANPFSSMSIGKDAADMVGFSVDPGLAPQNCAILATDASYPRAGWRNFAGVWDVTGGTLLLDGNVVATRGATVVGLDPLPGGSAFFSGIVPFGLSSSAVISRLRLWYSLQDVGALQQIFENERLEYGV
jgi:hypothetical protein